jgi:flagellar assembly protein FliH
MTSAAPAKFRFDLDLGHREERNSVLTESALAAIVSTARAEGYSDGLAEGQRAAVVRAAERLAQSAERLADHAAAVSAAMDDHRQATVQDAVGLAAAIGRKLAGALLATQPTVEIEALITECLASLDHVPHLVIRCAPELADAVREIAMARIANSGFTGRLVVLGDPDRASVEAEIDRRIQNFVAAQGAHATPAEGSRHEQ